MKRVPLTKHKDPDGLGRYVGCFMGLSVGDSLGAPVEFLSHDEILERYGPHGVVSPQEWGGFPAGTYTDDTQMSLATAQGLLTAHVLDDDDDVDAVLRHVHGAYLGWQESQSTRRLRRAPGTTCLSALRSGLIGTIDKPINNSKGCGGVMRVAPVGLSRPPGAAFHLGAEVAAITHGHPSGYLPAGVLSELIAGLKAGHSLPTALSEAVRPLTTYHGHQETLHAIDAAGRLAESTRAAADEVQALGEGWTGDSALAIALYCCLKHPTDWTTGVLAAVNHGGDSDSTGSITGAILGTLLGIDAIPTQWVGTVESGDVIQCTSEAMYRAFAEARIAGR